MKGERDGRLFSKSTCFRWPSTCLCCSQTETVGEAQRRHYTWPTASAALGRAMTASVMMGAMLTGEEKLTVKIEGDGPLGHILVDSNAKGEVRGYVANPQTHFDLNEHGKLDVRRAVGTAGTLTVVKDIGMRDFFTGQVPIVSGELGEDFTYYFCSLNKFLLLLVLGCLLILIIPFLLQEVLLFSLCRERKMKRLRKLKINLKAMPPISKLIEKG